jgi:hypothetical protein
VRWKSRLFKTFWWLVPAVCALAVTAIVVWAAENKLELVGSVVAAGLAFCYFAQTQKLQEAQLLKDLLTGFNERYDKLNDDLDIPEDCKPQEVGRFNSAARDYFNLCAEEYLFWNLGYILPSVWSAWSAGMRRRFKDPRIQGIWGVEVEAYRESYYGFDKEVDQFIAAACSDPTGVPTEKPA